MSRWCAIGVIMGLSFTGGAAEAVATVARQAAWQGPAQFGDGCGAGVVCLTGTTTSCVDTTALAQAEITLHSCSAKIEGQYPKTAGACVGLGTAKVSYSDSLGNSWDVVVLVVADGRGITFRGQRVGVDGDRVLAADGTVAAACGGPTAWSGTFTEHES
jgi:hypothetical protein